MKMISIGLGKFAGAQKYHAHSQRLGLEHVIRAAGPCAAVGQDRRRPGDRRGRQSPHGEARRRRPRASGARRAEPRARQVVDAAAAVRRRRAIVDEMGRTSAAPAWTPRSSIAARRAVPVRRPAVGDAPLHPRSASGQLGQRARRGDGGRDDGSAGGCDRLDADTRQCAQFGNPVEDPRADALCHRPRMPRLGQRHGGEGRGRGRDLRLDPQHAGARAPGGQRESAIDSRPTPPSSTSSPSRGIAQNLTNPFA